MAYNNTVRINLFEKIVVELKGRDGSFHLPYELCAITNAKCCMFI